MVSCPVLHQAKSLARRYEILPLKPCTAFVRDEAFRVIYQTDTVALVAAGDKSTLFDVKRMFSIQLHR
jgi:hypothetical protein